MFLWLKNTARNEQRQLFVDKSPRALEPESRKVQIMARRSGDSGGGSDDPKKKNVALGFLEEAAEFATGVLAGSALHSILRAGAAGALRGLKGNLFEGLFGSGRGKSEDAKADDLSSAPSKLLRSVTNASGDAKLGQLAQEYLANIIAIQTSGRPETDKAKAIEEAKAKYKAAVNEHLLAKSKGSLQNLMAELSDQDMAGGRTPPSGRPASYRADFFQWLMQELTPAQRQLVMARRGKIASIRVITDMLDYSGNAQDRFTYFQFALGQPEVKELAGEIAQAAVTGTLSEHPFIKGLATSSRHGANVRTIQRRVTSARRSRWNKL